MEIVTVNGATLSTLALGQGAMLVFVHGLVSGSMASWYFSQAVPLATTRRVVLYDQRGHGDSSVALSGYDLETQVADLAAVTALHERGNAGKIDLVGHSMGALIALQFALQYPKKLRKLVLIDAPLPAAEHVAPSLLAIKSTETLRAYISSQFPTKHGGRREERLYQRLSQLFFESSLLKDVFAMAVPPARALAALAIPTLLLYGNASPCLRAGAYLQKKLPNAQLRTLDCGHYVPEEAPAALLSALALFLREGFTHSVISMGEIA